MGAQGASAPRQLRALPDYFPLAAGLFWVYRTESPRGRRTVREEIVSAVQEGPALRARGRCVVAGRAEGREFSVVKDASGVRVDAVLELPEPPALGASWEAAGDSCRIAALDGVVEAPGGRFTACLRVAYLIAGGDAGSGERFYAPGVGLVREVRGDEADPFERVLLSWGRTTP